MYIRLGKRGEPSIHRYACKIKIGKAISISKGCDIAIIATGTALHLARCVSDALSAKGLSINLISMHTIKPLDKNTIEKLSKQDRAIFTIEEHTIIGGLGSAVAEILIELGYKGLFKRFGIPDSYCLVIGKRDYLCKEFSLDAIGITRSILKLLAIGRNR